MIKEDRDYEGLSEEIILSLLNEQHKVIAITSTEHGQGKTRSFRKLALAFAKIGKNVLIVDNAFRNPQIHKIMGLTNKNGLAQILEGKNLPEEVVCPSFYQGIYVLTAGELSGSAEEKLAKDKLKDLINELGANFNYVLINTSPINGHIDAMMLARTVSGYVITASEEIVHSSSFQHALDKLEMVQGKVIKILEIDYH